MSQYNGTTQIYNAWKEYIAKAANLASDSFKCLLVNNSYSPNLSLHSVLADITNEISGNGYARQTLANVAFAQASGTAKFTADSLVFSATGGSWTARRYVIFNDTVSSPTKPLVCVGLLNDANADVTVTDGNTLTIQIPTNGLFTLS